MTLVVGTNTWITEAEADTYFASRLGASEYWLSGASKEAALVTAYRQLNASYYAFPTAIAGITANMKYAQCEQALFLLSDTGVDARMNLQAQNVKSAGIIKESYGNKDIDVPAICSMAKALLVNYESIPTNRRGTFLIELDRDETDIDMDL